jgi:hypothetical protein
MYACTDRFHAASAVNPIRNFRDKNPPRVLIVDDRMESVALLLDYL